MAYTSSSKRTSYTTNSRGVHQQPTYSHAQEHHVIDEHQPHYTNEQISSRDHRRTGGGVSCISVCQTRFQ